MKKEDRQRMTRDRFELLFQKDLDTYERQTKQDDIILKIIEALHINDGNTIVDLGTGTGYLAFTIAKLYPYVHVAGVDIVDLTLEMNREKATKDIISNIEFVVTDGIQLPFADESVDCIVTRFALHHFVEIEKSFMEFNRILKKGGQLFISDPTPNNDDNDNFVNIFMQLVPDGHVTFYRKSEFDNMAEVAGFKEESCFLTSVCFPSKSRTEGYLLIEANIPTLIKESYAIEVIDNEVWVTEKVLNISYIKVNSDWL
jgi:ubiquinone/menaquinone biosynthesis C-methylase UbiE